MQHNIQKPLLIWYSCGNIVFSLLMKVCSPRVCVVGRVWGEVKGKKDEMGDIHVLLPSFFPLLHYSLSSTFGANNKHTYNNSNNNNSNNNNIVGVIYIQKTTGFIVLKVKNSPSFKSIYVYTKLEK